MSYVLDREMAHIYPAIGKKNVIWPNLITREAGRCSVAKTDYNSNTMGEGEKGLVGTADRFYNTA